MGEPCPNLNCGYCTHHRGTFLDTKIQAKTSKSNLWRSSCAVVQNFGKLQENLNSHRAWGLGFPRSHSGLELVEASMGAKTYGYGRLDIFNKDSFYVTLCFRVCFNTFQKESYKFLLNTLNSLTDLFEWLCLSSLGQVL